MKNKKAQLTLARPVDRSLEAFKRWITNIVQNVKPGEDTSMTPEKWKERHKEFWKKIDQSETK